MTRGYKWKLTVKHEENFRHMSCLLEQYCRDKFDPDITKWFDSDHDYSFCVWFAYETNGRMIEMRKFMTFPFVELEVTELWRSENLVYHHAARIHRSCLGAPLYDLHVIDRFYNQVIAIIRSNYELIAAEKVCDMMAKVAD